MTWFPLRIARSALHQPATRHRYGEHPHQVADLHHPPGSGPYPVVVLLHGGYWQRPYTKLVMRPLCVDLVRRGYAALNVEYRRLGATAAAGRRRSTTSRRRSTISPIPRSATPASTSGA
jgi:hypothetical protein